MYFEVCKKIVFMSFYEENSRRWVFVIKIWLGEIMDVVYEIFLVVDLRLKWGRD